MIGHFASCYDADNLISIKCLSGSLKKNRNLNKNFLSFFFLSLSLCRPPFIHVAAALPIPGILSQRKEGMGASLFAKLKLREVVKIRREGRGGGGGGGRGGRVTVSGNRCLLRPEKEKNIYSVKAVILFLAEKKVGW